MSVTESDAVKPAADWGVNVSEIVQLAPAATDEPQVLAWAKSLAFALPMVMLVMESAALPGLVRVIVCD